MTTRKRAMSRPVDGLVGCRYEFPSGARCGRSARYYVPTRDFPLCGRHARIWRDAGIKLCRVAANAPRQVLALSGNNLQAEVRQ